MYRNLARGGVMYKERVFYVMHALNAGEKEDHCRARRRAHRMGRGRPEVMHSSKPNAEEDGRWQQR